MANGSAALINSNHSLCGMVALAFSAKDVKEDGWVVVRLLFALIMNLQPRSASS